MGRKIIAIIIFLAGSWAGCTGTKKVTGVAEGQKKQTTALSDEKKKEFEYLFVEALKQKMLGNMQKAVSLLSACLEIDPNSSAAMNELAGMHIVNNDLTSAALLLEKATTIDPSNKWFKLQLAQIYQQTNKQAEAAAIYEQLIRIEPDNHEYLYLKAMSFSLAKKYDEAIKAFNELEKKTGPSEFIAVTRQQIYQEAGKIKEAFAEIEKLISQNPGEARYYGLLADLYLDEGDKDNALKYYNQILEIEPDNGFVHFSLANFYKEQGDQERSFEHTLKGFDSPEVDLETKLQMYLLHTGNLAEKKLTDEQNEQMIRVLQERHSDDFRVYTVYAEFLIRNKKNREAREQLLRVLELGMNEYMIWEQVVYLDNDLQDWESLMKHSRSALDYFPNQPMFYFFNAIANLQLNKYQEAISISEEGFNYVVDNPQMKGQFLFLKGEAHYKMGKIADGFRLFDESVKHDPDNHIALNNFSYYLSLENRDLEKAERMSAKVIERFPNNPTYLDTYAWVLFKKGNYTLAKFYMETALNNGGNENPTLLDHYGDILFMLGRTDEALQYWRKAIELGDDSPVLKQKVEEKRYIEEKK